MTQHAKKICISLTRTTLEDLLAALEQAQQIADYVELRIDYLENPNPDILKKIASHLRKKTILCCRSTAHGGQFSGSLAEQQAILQAGNDLKFDYLDIDLAIAPRILITNKFSQHIISYHNFNGTPALTELQAIAELMRSFNADVMKIAVFAQDALDAQRLYQFLLSKQSTEKMIALAMGKAGQITRLLAPWLGSYLTYASLLGEHSAPGQIDYHTMRRLYDDIDSSLGN